MSAHLRVIEGGKDWKSEELAMEGQRRCIEDGNAFMAIVQHAEAIVQIGKRMGHLTVISQIDFERALTGGEAA